MSLGKSRPVSASHLGLVGGCRPPLTVSQSKLIVFMYITPYTPSQSALQNSWHLPDKSRSAASSPQGSKTTSDEPRVFLSSNLCQALRPK